jgi:ribosome biogenesis GTPase / thiamine phosphate phosphatase
MELASPGAEIFVVSSFTGAGIEELRAALPSGMTTAFVGRSGVGKSSLINAIVDTVIMETGDVREADSKGRHTTTHRQITLLASGVLVVDTPGLREFALFSNAESLDTTFDDIAALSQDCRFSDCSHASEPGCAVHAAIEDGSLKIERFESYLRLQRELAYLQTKELQRSKQVREVRNKQIAIFQKQLKRIKRR